MRVVYSHPWAGFSSGAWQTFNTVGYSHLYFAFYNEQGGNDLWVYARNSAGTLKFLQLSAYTETQNIPPRKWIWVRIPIIDFGLGSAPILTDIGVESGVADSVVYFDEITFGASITFYKGIQAEKGPGTMLWSWNTTWSQPNDGASDGYKDYWLQVNPTAPWGGIQLQQQATGIMSPQYGGLTVAQDNVGFPDDPRYLDK
jgi:hypothetical protein